MDTEEFTLDDFIIERSDVFAELESKEKSREVLHEPTEKNCSTCRFENGMLCDSALGSCKLGYEHYEPRLVF